MPALPKLVADLVEPRFAKRSRVARIDMLAPRLARVLFAGSELQDLSFRAGQEIELRVDATAFRHYTPSAYNARSGTMEVIFYLHGKGPGSHWAHDLRVGRDAGILGPGGRFSLASTTTHVFLGDETCLGLFVALDGAVSVTQRVLGAIEVEPGCESWPMLVGVPLAAVPRKYAPSPNSETPIVAPSVRRGAALHAWLDRAELAPSSDTTFYLAGHAATITSLRDTLRSRGWSRSAIRTKPYWADGKRGL